MSLKLNGIAFCEDTLKDCQISSYVQTGLVDKQSDCTENSSAIRTGLKGNNITRIKNQRMHN
jgi:hypothetical protein